MSKTNRTPRDTCKVHKPSCQESDEARAFPLAGREKQCVLTLARDKLNLLNTGLQFCSLKRYRIPGRQKRLCAFRKRPLSIAQLHPRWHASPRPASPAQQQEYCCPEVFILKVCQKAHLHFGFYPAFIHQSVHEQSGRRLAEKPGDHLVGLQGLGR